MEANCASESEGVHIDIRDFSTDAAKGIVVEHPFRNKPAQLHFLRWFAVEEHSVSVAVDHLLEVLCLEIANRRGAFLNLQHHGVRIAYGRNESIEIPSSKVAEQCRVTLEKPPNSTKLSLVPGHWLHCPAIEGNH